MKSDYSKVFTSIAISRLKFVGKTREEIGEKLQLIRGMHGTTSILTLLSILDLMARSEEFIYLNAATYISDVHEKSSEKINKVYHYTIENFRKRITLSEVASLPNHSAVAFCRYFKTRTRKSYFQYLTEIRIAYACELLSKGDFNVSEVCLDSGFNNLSYFHKQFKKVVKSTPTEHQKRSRMKVPL
ncbi:MAG: AraC family transcriptional regulator [Cyclobacteriaceae bacterium]